jgi:mRNA interferase RelE/StbE
LKVEFKSSFARDLKRIRGKKLKDQIKEVIEQIEQAQGLDQIVNIKKLAGSDNYYRIKLANYRIGLILKDDSIIFVRFLHRKDIYRYFP